MFLKALLPWLLLWGGGSCAWTISPGAEIFDEVGSRVRVKGISWFGFETPDGTVDGLWAHPMSWYLDLLASEAFNVIRVPFCAQWVLQEEGRWPSGGMVGADWTLQGKTSFEVLDALFEESARRNVSLMLDLHRLNNQYISELWYDPNNGAFTSDKYFEAWFKVLDRYQDRPNLVAVDILNEPHGRATWGSGDPSTDWQRFASFALEKFDERYPASRWLYLVEGVNWGGDLQGARDHPLEIPPNLEGRVAYSLHTYGRSVVPSINSGDVAGLRNHWQNAAFFLKDRGQAVIVGEWGGQTYLDADWMNHLADFLIEKDCRDNFFWSLGPNSGDVAGYLLDNWTDVDNFKREVCRRVQPDPYPRPHAA